MKEYLEQVLHRPVELTLYPDTGKLPLTYQNNVRIYRMTVDSMTCLLIEPVDIMTLPELRRCFKQISRFTSHRCALYLRQLTYYAKDAFLKEGIPFVWEKRQLYLPFFGMMLNSQDERRLEPCDQISFLTQKLLLRALYETWTDISVSRAAELLRVSKMSITRCFDEVEALGLPVLKVKSRARKLCAKTDKREMWQLIRPVLRDPVIRKFQLSEIPRTDLPMSGISALAEYSMLEDDPFPSYAIEKRDLKAQNAGSWKQISVGEQPACVVHEVGYLLPFGDHNTIDPLSVSLMLKDEMDTDPRIDLSVRKMLEDHVW